MVEARGRGTRSARPASAPAGWGLSDRGLADDCRLPRLPRLGGRPPTSRPARSPAPAWGWPPGCCPGPCSAAGGTDDPRRLAAATPFRLLAAPAAPQCDPGPPVRPGRDRLRRGRGPGLDRPRPGRRRPQPTTGQPGPSRAVADIPGSYLRLYRQAGPATASPGRCWRPSARSSPTTAGPGSPGSDQEATAGPAGRCRSASWDRQQGRQPLGLATAAPPPRPRQRHPGRGPHLVDHGARRNLDRAISPTTTPVLCGQGQAAGPPLRHRGGGCR